MTRPDIPSIIEALRERGTNWLSAFKHYEGHSVYVPDFIKLSCHDFLRIGQALGWKDSPAGLDKKGVSVFHHVEFKP